MDAIADIDPIAHLVMTDYSFDNGMITTTRQFDTRSMPVSAEEFADSVGGTLGDVAALIPSDVGEIESDVRIDNDHVTIEETMTGLGTAVETKVVCMQFAAIGLLGPLAGHDMDEAQAFVDALGSQILPAISEEALA